MSIVLLVAGLGLVILALGDMVWTTVSASAGGGIVTTRLTTLVWAAVRRLAPDDGALRHRVLRVGGLGVVLSVFVAWTLLTWTGWSLAFSATPDAAVSSSTDLPASFVERVWFAGYTLSTMGNGGFAPGPGAWKVLAGAASITGLAAATMGITYLVPVVSAVVQRATIARRIASLADDPEELVIRGWRSGDWQRLEDLLLDLSPALTQVAQQHLAYPVLHFFHVGERRAAFAVQLAKLDEAVTLLRFALPPEVRPDATVLASVSGAIEDLVDAVARSFTSEEGVTEPDPPSLDRLAAAGVPLVDADEFEAQLRTLAGRRTALAAMVRDDGWAWEDVVGPERISSDQGVAREPSGAGHGR